MAFIDFLLGALLIFGIVRGLWNGFIIELASLLSLLVGIWAAIKFSHVMRSVLRDHADWSPKTIQITAFVLTFILVVVAITILAKALTTIVSIAGLGIFNKLLGAVVGMLKTALIISVMLNLLGKVNGSGNLIDQSTIDKSLFYNPIQKMAAFLYPTIESWYHGIKPEAEPTSIP